MTYTMAGMRFLGKCCTYDNEWLGSEGVMREMNQSVYKEYHGASMIPRAVYVIT